MIYSYTQISQYLTCPRRYRYRYLDGWRERDTRAAMLFGRAFEDSLASYFRREDSVGVLKGDSWDRMLQQGVQLLDRFCQDDRVRISRPRRNLQIKFTRSLARNNDFVAYIDGIGQLDGTRCLLEWKTTSSRYPEEPEGLLALDPQLVCYSWITGIAQVAQIVFVRKRFPEVQYLRTTITDEQRQEFGRLAEDAIQRIESAQFLPHSGIRFPQNPCSTSCWSSFPSQSGGQGPWFPHPDDSKQVGSVTQSTGQTPALYDTELLRKDEIDDQALVGLQGVLKVSHVIVRGISVLNLDGFATLSRWKELSPTAVDNPPGSEVA
jgi:PD-(D/E)XK nuclease superfamily